ncbi:MAG: hypothetical protein WCZ65_04805 [Lysobacteraceae bacterium]
MSRLDTTPLSAEEAALAEVYRRLPGDEPPASLDAHLRAQAHAAVRRAPSRRVRIWRWGGGAMAAALALGIGLQVLRSPIERTELPQSEAELHSVPPAESVTPDAGTFNTLPTEPTADIAPAAAPATRKTTQEAVAPPPAAAPMPQSAAPPHVERSLDSMSRQADAQRLDRIEVSGTRLRQAAAPPASLEQLIERARAHHREGDAGALKAILMRIQHEHPDAELPADVRGWIDDLPAAP